MIPLNESEINEIIDLAYTSCEKYILKYVNKKELSKFATKTGKSFNKINYVGEIDEVAIINDAKDYLEQEVGAKIKVYDEPTYDPQNKSQNASPYKPAIYLE